MSVAGKFKDSRGNRINRGGVRSCGAVTGYSRGHIEGSNPSTACTPKDLADVAFSSRCCKASSKILQKASLF